MSGYEIFEIFFGGNCNPSATPCRETEMEDDDFIV